MHTAFTAKKSMLVYFSLKAQERYTQDGMFIQESVWQWWIHMQYIFCSGVTITLSPDYKGNIWEEIAVTSLPPFSSFPSADFVFPHNKPFVFLSCMKLHAGEITFIQIIFMTLGYPISPYLFKPLFSSFPHRRLQWAGKGKVCVVWLFPPLSRLFLLANSAVCFHCLLTASRVL